jgi:hypothetical protein
VLGEATVLMRATVLEMMMFVGATALKPTVPMQIYGIIGATVLEASVLIGATVFRATLFEATMLVGATVLGGTQRVWVARIDAIGPVPVGARRAL